jgi:hypothetical protein
VGVSLGTLPGSFHETESKRYHEEQWLCAGQDPWPADTGSARARPTNAQAISSFYRIAGPSETLTAPFVSSTGVSTIGLFSGPVEISVSGTGSSDGTLLNDAFYFLPGQMGAAATAASSLSSSYQLGLGTDSQSFGSDPALDDIQNNIVFISGVGQVSAGTIPTFNPTNTYDFVLAVPDASLTPLTFGVLDGGHSDNSGSYTVTVTPLSPGAAPAVPEAPAGALLALGLLPVFLVVRRGVSRVA